MELGLDFDDGDFEEKVREKRILTNYNAKICHEEWFLSESQAEAADDSDRATVLKFRGDYYYHKKDFRAAEECYKACLDNLGASNRTMRREMFESLARCHIATGNFRSAEVYIDQVKEDSVTVENICHSLILQQLFYQKSGNLLDEVRVLHQLVSVHPVNAHFWLQLAEAYEEIRDFIESGCMYNVRARTQQVDCCCNLDSELIIEDGVQVLQFQNDERVCCNDKPKPLNTEKEPKSGGDTDQDKMTAQDAVQNSELCDRDLPNTQCCQYCMADSAGTRCVISQTSDNCSRDFQEILTGYPVSLLLLTCYVRTRLIFLSVQGTAGSFIKNRNIQHVQELVNRIKALSVDEKLLDEVTQFVQRDLFEEDAEDGKPEQNPDVKDCTRKYLCIIFCMGRDINLSDAIYDAYKEKEVEPEEFNRRWFSWIQESHIST